MSETITDDNFFDYAEAIHCFASLNHSGQWSDLYSILSRSEFSPGPMWTHTRCEQENPVYSEITEQNVSELFEELTNFMERLSDYERR